MKLPKIRTISLTVAALVFAASAWAPAFASENPLDKVGVEHNVYLACLMREGSDASISPLQRVVKDCGFAPGTSTEEFVAKYSSLVGTDPYLPVVERMEPYRKSYTDHQFSYFYRIDEVIETAETPEMADAMFAKLESEAAASLRTETAAEQSIFAALSTARHSLRYWWAATEGQAELMEQPVEALRMRRIWKVLLVVGADLLGAGGGTLIGGPVVGAATGSASSAGAASVLK